MNETVIKTEQLTKRYGKHTVVNKVNLHVKKGRIYGLLGRNGAGTTTIMKMILGYIPNLPKLYSSIKIRKLEMHLLTHVMKSVP